MLILFAFLIFISYFYYVRKRAKEFYSFLLYRIGDDLRYAYYDFGARLGYIYISAELARALLALFFAWKIAQHV